MKSLQTVPTRAETFARAEDAAKAIKESFPEIQHLVDQAQKLRSKFAKVAEEYRREFLIVRDYFANKPMKEQLLGKYRTGEQWAQGELDMTYKHFCRCVPKMEAPKFLLPAPTEDAVEAETEETESKDTTSLEARAASLTKLFKVVSHVAPSQTPDHFNLTVHDLTAAQIKKLAATLKTETDKKRV